MPRNKQMKLKLLVAATSAVLILQASAALMQINNLVAGAGDTLYANNDNSLMSAGVVTIGYFPDGVNPTDIASLLANIGSFTVIDSQTAGTHFMFAGPPFNLQTPGYAATATAQQVPGGAVTGDNPLLGRAIYSIISNAASLAAATSDNQFAMVSLGVFLDDDPSENTYIANPAGRTAIIGGFDTTVIEGENYFTLKMAVGGGPADPYDTWAGPGNAFDGDKNGDGVDNGLAFLLGAANPDANALGKLPTAGENAGGLVLKFQCLDAASRGPAALKVQSSKDLGLADLWHANEAAVPEPPGGTVNGVVFVVTENAVDPTRNDVVATIPLSEAPSGKLFGRLSGTE
jgi:hypothetical protein